MRIKTVPEDFFVHEIPKRSFSEEGELFVYRATKRDRTTQDMVSALSRLNGVQPRDIRYAGLKDRRAITTQLLSSPKALTKSPDDVKLKLIGKTDEHLHLGDLKANAFRIVVRDVTEVRDVAIPNYFGDQRFSTENVERGLMLVKGDFFGLAHLLAKEHPSVRRRVEQDPTGAVQALQAFPFRILLLYVHAVQSWLFNEAVSAWVADNNTTVHTAQYRHGVLRFPKTLPDKHVPLIGAVSELGEWEKYYAPLLTKAGITQQSFLVRAFPTLTQEGDVRSLRADVREKSLKQDSNSVVAEFVLGPGCYATVCLAGWCC